MAHAKLHLIVYALFAVSVVFDLATTAVCFQVNNSIAETNLIYIMSTATLLAALEERSF
jgi:hypothetical protein